MNKPIAAAARALNGVDRMRVALGTVLSAAAVGAGGAAAWTLPAHARYVETRDRAASAQDRWHTERARLHSLQPAPETTAGRPAPSAATPTQALYRDLQQWPDLRLRSFEHQPSASGPERMVIILDGDFASLSRWLSERELRYPQQSCELLELRVERHPRAVLQLTLSLPGDTAEMSL